MLGRKKGTIAESYYRELIELEEIPKRVESMISINDYIKELSAKFKDVPNFLYLGRGYNFPVALEGAFEAKRDFFTFITWLFRSRNGRWPHCID